jgi:hypothetical protein
MVGPHALRRAGGEGISAGAATMVAAQRSRPARDVALERRRRFAYRLCLE